MFTLIFAAALTTAPAGAPQATLSTPKVVAEVDAGKLKGDFSRLAWSADGSEFYIQTVEKDRNGAPKAVHHYVVSAASKSVKSADHEPPWAAAYWEWKSGRSSPAAASFKIDVNERTETRRSVAAPTGGALAKGGTVDPTGGTPFTDVAAAADTSQTIKIYSLVIKGETIGEWANEAVVPGANYSWAPAPLQLIAFAKRDGGPLVVVDESGRKQELAGPREAFFPAWSGDGRKIAWLERTDRKKYQLKIADISMP
jgi:WD40 repeat protein